MSELRTRMIQAMTARGFSPRTQEAYVRAVVGLARHYQRAPDQLSADDVQAYIALLFRERSESVRGARAARRPTRSGSSTT
jgi:integrase/recombinase XerD